MAQPPKSGPSPWRHRLSYLKYALIWPIYNAYRQKTARSLRWRLTGSHLATVFLSIIATSVIGALLVIAIFGFDDPRTREPATEARIVAELIARTNAEEPLNNEELSAILLGFSTGEIGRNAFSRELNFWATIGREFENVRSISVVDRNSMVTASSDRSLVGQDAGQTSPAAPDIVQLALGGSTDEEKNSVVRPEASLITGAYPIKDSAGNVVGAVVVDKREPSFPAGWRWVALMLTFVGEVGLTAALIVVIPAIPVAAIIGIRRANTISQPVRELAGATQAFSKGQLDARVPIRSQDEIGALEDNFNYMADQLETALEEEAELRERAEKLLAANRDLIANVSHELRTPVALIRGHVEALQNEPGRTEEYTRIALRETDRLERLVEDLFQLTRLESNRIELSLENADARSVVREAIESLSGPAKRDADLTLMTQFGDGDLTCRCDRQRLVQVLQNLIRNAIRFTPPGGIILGTAKRVQDRIEIAIHDTGAGIPPEVLPNIFERFFRADQSRTRAAGGSGLGLAIAKELVEAMGGTISVESNVDEGSTFTIRLQPVQVQTEPANEAPAPAAVHSK
jgi:signal transduction histidine kinase